jgi:hypothetical protein
MYECLLCGLEIDLKAPFFRCVFYNTRKIKYFKKKNSAKLQILHDNCVKIPFFFELYHCKSYSLFFAFFKDNFYICFCSVSWELAVHSSECVVVDLCRVQPPPPPIFRIYILNIFSKLRGLVSNTFFVRKRSEVARPRKKGLVYVFSIYEKSILISQQKRFFFKWSQATKYS